MDQMLLLVLVSCAIYCVIGTLNPSKIFYFVNQPKSFDEAQRFCRDYYTDLVTLWGRAETQELFALENLPFTGSAWIGLKKTSPQQWQWSLSDQEFYKQGETEYRNWGPGEPNNRAGEYCSVMDEIGNLRDTQCEPTRRTFICYNGQNNTEQKYILIKELKLWREAQSYCREFYTDLVSVRNSDENSQIQRHITTGVAYIGLFRDDFNWSDSSNSSFRNWDSGQPDGSGECVAQQLQDRRLWDDQTCSSPRPFFCYAIPVFKQVLRLELKSDQNLKNPCAKATILQEIQQRLISQGMSEMSNLQWRQQPNGQVFQSYDISVPPERLILPEHCNKY